MIEAKRTLFKMLKQGGAAETAKRQQKLAGQNTLARSDQEKGRTLQVRPLLFVKIQLMN